MKYRKTIGCSTFLVILALGYLLPEIFARSAWTGLLKQPLWHTITDFRAGTLVGDISLGLVCALLAVSLVVGVRAYCLSGADSGVDYHERIVEGIEVKTASGSPVEPVVVATCGKKRDNRLSALPVEQIKQVSQLTSASMSRGNKNPVLALTHAAELGVDVQVDRRPTPVIKLAMPSAIITMLWWSSHVSLPQRKLNVWPVFQGVTWVPEAPVPVQEACAGVVAVRQPSMKLLPPTTHPKGAVDAQPQTLMVCTPRKGASSGDASPESVLDGAALYSEVTPVEFKLPRQGLGLALPAVRPVSADHFNLVVDLLAMITSSLVRPSIPSTIFWYPWLGHGSQQLIFWPVPFCCEQVRRSKPLLQSKSQPSQGHEDAFTRIYDHDFSPIMFCDQDKSDLIYEDIEPCPDDASFYEYCTLVLRIVEGESTEGAVPDDVEICYKGKSLTKLRNWRLFLERDDHKINFFFNLYSHLKSKNHEEVVDSNLSSPSCDELSPEEISPPSKKLSYEDGDASVYHKLREVTAAYEGTLVVTSPSSVNEGEDVTPTPPSP